MPAWKLSTAHALYAVASSAMVLSGHKLEWPPHVFVAYLLLHLAVVVDNIELVVHHLFFIFMYLLYRESPVEQFAALYIMEASVPFLNAHLVIKGPYTPWRKSAAVISFSIFRLAWPLYLLFAQPSIPLLAATAINVYFVLHVDCSVAQALAMLLSVPVVGLWVGGFRWASVLVSMLAVFAFKQA